MSDLTEHEIFDRMMQSLKSAAHLCELLASRPVKGPNYHNLRTELLLIEGCCRQAAAWREDTRWLGWGLLMSEVHKRSGNWLRAEARLTVKRHAETSKLFLMLMANLCGMYVQIEHLRTSATGRRGIILPDMLPAPHRDTRPVPVDGHLLAAPA